MPDLITLALAKNYARSVVLNGTLGNVNNGVDKDSTTRKDINTKILMHCDKLKDDSFLFDSSAYSLVCEGIPTIKLSSECKKFGDSSLYLDGTTRVNIGDVKDFNFGYSDFTIELWILLRDYQTTSRMGIFTKSNNARNTYLIFEILSGRLNTAVSINNSVIWHLSSNVLDWKDEQWYHLALVKSGASVKFYRDGVHCPIDTSYSFHRNYNGSAPVPLIDDIAHIGSFGSNRYFIGNFDEVRISDIARWQDNFQTPAKPYEINIVNNGNDFTDREKCKSLYELATEGGYSGTEAEFYTDLSSLSGLNTFLDKIIGIEV